MLELKQKEIELIKEGMEDNDDDIINLDQVARILLSILKYISPESNPNFLFLNVLFKFTLFDL